MVVMQPCRTGITVGTTVPKEKKNNNHDIQTTIKVYEITVLGETESKLKCTLRKDLDFGQISS